MNKVNLVLSSLLLASSLSACAVSPANLPVNKVTLSGLVSINRVAPEISPDSVLLGFLPKSEIKDVSWIEIDKTSATLSFFEKGTLAEKISLDPKSLQAFSLQTGEYKIQHKQRNPLWYAGDEYFLARKLEIPEVGSRQRYLRGALGDFALFIDENTPIHSALSLTPEVKGLKIEEEKMKRIYYALEVGSTLEIR